MFSLLVIVLLFQVLFFVVGFFVYKHLLSSITLVHKRIDSLFTVDVATPNDATKKGSDLEELGEQNMLNIPSNVKFEVEGQDNIPPGYDVKNN